MARCRRVTPAFPFCSERCKLIDLGKWLGGDYAIPQQPEEDEGAKVPGQEEEER